MKASPSATLVRSDISARIAAGDVQALSDWFQSHKDRLYSFVFHRVGKDPDLAAEATQETFTAAMERLDEFDPERGNMTTWLKVLSRNIIRRLLSYRQNSLQVDAWLQDSYERIGRELLPESVVQRAETRALVGMTLSNLPPQYRDVLEAKYIEHQSLEAMAKDRETTVDAVKSMLRRARAAFRDTFLALAKTET